MLSSGHLLDNRYRLDERIATGGMGDVWRGTDVVLGRVIAVKVLRAQMLSDPEFAARFYGEARMMAAFRHPGVVEVYDYASADESAGEDQVAYLVMAYVEGEPLSARLKEEGSLPIGDTMSIVAQAADALHAAHQNGTVHRDVKPGNLIVKPNGTVILVDFGVARSAAVTSVTGLNAIVGTALYMAPEQVAKGNVSPATDIYALGAVAYHCISGRPPFDGDNALQVALRHLEDEPDPLPSDVPPAVRALITRAMAKDPARRFGTAAEFADAAMAAAGLADRRHQTGTRLTAPISPAAQTRSVPQPRHVPMGAYPAGTPQPAGIAARPAAARRTPRSQLVLAMIVLLLFLLAIALAITIKLTNGNGTADQLNPTLPPSVGATGDVPGDVPTDQQRTSAPTPTRNLPNGTGRTPSSSVKPSLTKPSSSAPVRTTPPAPKPTTASPTPTSGPTPDQPPGPTDTAPAGAGGNDDAGGVIVGAGTGA